MHLLIRILPSRPAPRDTRLASKWLAARLQGKPGQGGIVLPGSAPSCLPGPEMKMIMGIQELKQNQKSTLSGRLQQAETRAARELWFWPWTQQEGGQLLLGRSLSLCPSLSSQPASGEPATVFLLSEVTFSLALSWPGRSELAGSGRGGQMDSREGQTWASA